MLQRDMAVQAFRTQHHFVTCPDTMEFWSHVRNWWRAATNTNFALGIYDLIFGLPNEENDRILNQFNFILLYARYQIYTQKQTGRDKLILYELLVSVKNK
jgi:hypothetical protein